MRQTILVCSPEVIFFHAFQFERLSSSFSSSDEIKGRSNIRRNYVTYLHVSTSFVLMSGFGSAQSGQNSKDSSCSVLVLVLPVPIPTLWCLILPIRVPSYGAGACKPVFAKVYGALAYYPLAWVEHMTLIPAPTSLLPPIASAMLYVLLEEAGMSSITTKGTDPSDFRYSTETWTVTLFGFSTQLNVSVLSSASSVGKVSPAARMGDGAQAPSP
jgi:hypothetical protein